MGQLSSLTDHAGLIEPLRILAVWSPSSNTMDSLRFAAWLGRTTPIEIQVASTLIHPWGQASLSKLGGKYKKWLKEQTDAVAEVTKDALADAGIDKQYWAEEYSILLEGSNRPQLLTDAAARFGADLILLNAHHGASKHRILAGTTADALLHYSPVTVGMPPRHAKLSKHGVTRVSFGYTEEGGTHDDPALHTAARIATRWNVPLRILAFSPDGLVRAPMNDRLDVAKELAQEWREKSLGLLDLARDKVLESYPALEVTAELGSGLGWKGAVDSLKWKKGDLMLLGSTPLGPFTRVFIGSTAKELLPHLKIPVLIHPTAE